MEYIGFRTSGDWTVEEWNTCLISVSKIYNVFLAMKIVKEFEKGIPESFALNKLTVSKVLENLQDFADDSAKLRIHKIKMASPGGFSLQGSGEIIESTTEFIIKILEIIRITSEKKKLENEISKEELKRKKLENERYKEENEKIKMENAINKAEILGNQLKYMAITANVVNELPYFKKDSFPNVEQDDMKQINK
ncbi:MAG: hypothetical protein ABR936_17405 [Bacteroidota bacterium]